MANRKDRNKRTLERIAQAIELAESQTSKVKPEYQSIFNTICKLERLLLEEMGTSLVEKIQSGKFTSEYIKTACDLIRRIPKVVNSSLEDLGTNEDQLVAYEKNGSIYF